MHEALELRRKHKIDNQQRQQEHDADPGGCVHIGARLAIVAQLGLGRQDVFCDVLNLCQHVPQFGIRGKSARQLDRGQAIKAPERGGCGILRQGYERAKRHQRLAIARAQENVFDVCGDAAVCILGLHQHGIFAAPADKGRDFARGKHGLQRGRDHIGRDAQIICAGAVDLDVKLWQVLFEVDLGIDETLHCFDAFQQSGCPFLDALEIWTADNHLHWCRTAA